MLLRTVAEAAPGVRIRFTTSHPKDMSDRLLETMASMPNICRAIHLPAQSGASTMLRRMNRKYDREWYLRRIAAIRRYMPDCGITTDLIAGFSGETEEEHARTLSLMREVGYDFAFMFKYSERPGTFASKHLPDDVPEEVKQSRVDRIMRLQGEIALANNLRRVGRRERVIIDSRQGDFYVGRSQYDSPEVDQEILIPAAGRRLLRGRFYDVRITSAADYDLYGEVAGK